MMAACRICVGTGYLNRSSKLKTQQIQINFEVYTGVSELNGTDGELFAKAIAATKDAYAPYSNFKVAAVARLNNGEILSATNQENASYPVGICAERSLLSVTAALQKDVPIESMAITYHNQNGESLYPISPCGMCRQALVEYEERTHQNIRLILGGSSGEIYVMPSAKALLPLSFKKEDLSGNNVVL
jgi:cytidine deaminase